MDQVDEVKKLKIWQENNKYNRQCLLENLDALPVKTTQGARYQWNVAFLIRERYLPACM